MRISILIAISLFISCAEQHESYIELKEEVVEYDSSFWQATELVRNQDTIELGLDHLIFNIQDTFVHKWYFRNDTLRNLTQSNFCKCWIESNDSIVFPITCKNYWYDIGDEFTLENNHGIITRILILPGENEQEQYEDQYALDSAHIVIRRKLIPTEQSLYLSRLNELSMDTLVVLR